MHQVLSRVGARPGVFWFGSPPQSSRIGESLFLSAHNHIHQGRASVSTLARYEWSSSPPRSFTSEHPRTLTTSADTSASSSTSITKFEDQDWKVEENALKLPKGEFAKVVSLPRAFHDLVGLGTKQRLLVRDCHDKLYDFTVEHLNSTNPQGYVLLGNPGIGKSWFLVYLLVRLLNSNIGRPVIFQTAGDSFADLFLPGSKTREVISKAQVDRLCRSSSEYIVLFNPASGVSQQPVMNKGTIIVASSPDERSYQQFIKEIGYLYRIMPCWSEKEIEAVKDIAAEPKKVMERFQIIGGIPRVLFAEEDKYTSFVLRIKDAAREFPCGAFLQSTVELTMAMSSKLLRLVPGGDVHYNGYSFKFQTDCIQQWVIEARWKKDWKRMFSVLEGDSDEARFMRKESMFEQFVFFSLGHGIAFKSFTVSRNNKRVDEENRQRFPQFERRPFSSNEFKNGLLELSNPTASDDKLFTPHSLTFAGIDAFALHTDENGQRHLFFFQVKSGKAKDFCNRDLALGNIKSILKQATSTTKVNTSFHLVAIPTTWEGILDSGVTPISNAGDLRAQCDPLWFKVTTLDLE